MLVNMNSLELTAKDIELIEAALHTQKMILSVQSEAGGTGAQQKLGDLKHLLKRVGRARPVVKGTSAMSWAQTAFCMISSQGRCGQS